MSMVQEAYKKYREAVKAYTSAAAKRVQYETDLELDFLERYLKERGEKKTENEAKAAAKLKLAERYAKLAEMKAQERKLEGEVDIYKAAWRTLLTLEQVGGK